MEHVGGIVDQRRAEGGAEVIEEDEACNDPKCARPDGATDRSPGLAELALADLALGLANQEDAHGQGNQRKDRGD